MFEALNLILNTVKGGEEEAEAANSLKCDSSNSLLWFPSLFSQTWETVFFKYILFKK